MSDAEYCAIGLGPSNLSLGALAATAGIAGIHLERDEEFRWHPGMLIRDATIQVPMLKDLVSAVDPQNPLSFTNFLVEHNRFYEHLNCGFDRILRAEYEQYLVWAASRLPSVTFGAEVIDIDFDGRNFVTSTKNEQWKTPHVVLGVGQIPHIPVWAMDAPPQLVAHSSRFVETARSVIGEDIVVVGGGQSGAEIVFNLATRPNPPSNIHWITRRSALHPLNESAFANDLFGPTALHEFYALPEAEREVRLAEQKFASDGINTDLLKKIYQHTYSRTHLKLAGANIRVSTSTEARQLRLSSGGTDQVTLEVAENGRVQEIRADLVILATGYRQELPSFLSNLSPRLQRQGSNLCVSQDFNVMWDGPDENKMFIQNGAAHAFGVAEPNLSLMPYRSSRILRAMKGVHV